MVSKLENFKRALKINLPARRSAFLWGARQTGKSTYLKLHFPKSIRYDLLQSDVYLKLLKKPQLLREELLYQKPSRSQQPIIIDEVQKIPLLLDEIHWLIENANLQFLLCGSSARKLKRSHANLLGGRAWRYEMYPLTFQEIPDFNLLQALQRGLLPSHYPDPHYKKSLKAYVNDYLTEEIKAEGLARNLASFAKFLDAVSYSNGQLLNYTNIASDCGVDNKTVKEYFEILKDTHLGYDLLPLSKKKGRKSILSTPKFYLFDVGVANFLSNTQINILKGEAAGKSLEQLLFCELMAYRSYKEKNFSLNYWKTKTGLEVDFILNKNEIYIETKISQNVKKGDFKGLNALIDESKPKNAYLVCLEKTPRIVTSDKGQKITILPVYEFLKKLWKNEII